MLMQVGIRIDSIHQNTFISGPISDLYKMQVHVTKNDANCKPNHRNEW